MWDRSEEQNTAVANFYFDFAARKEQTATSILGSMLKQIVSGMETIPEEISRAFREQKKAVGGHGVQLSDMMKMLWAVTPLQPTYMCIDALDECLPAHRAKLLSVLGNLLQKSPDTRIFLTGRPHIRAEVERCLTGWATSVSIVPRKDDIVAYIRARLNEDYMPDAMDESLAADMLQKIPETMSEMCVPAMALIILPQINC